MTRSVEASSALQQRGYRVTSFSGHRKNAVSGWFAELWQVRQELASLKRSRKYPARSLAITSYWLNGKPINER